MRTDISRASYAHLWVTDEARRLWQELAQDVYPYDHISSGLRNRFYLERLSAFVADHKDGAFVNIAAQELLYSDTRSRQDRNDRLPILFAVLDKT